MSTPLASGDVLGRFLDRIGRELADEPLRADPEEHRRRLAELLAVVGSATHYELLEIDPKAGEAEVHAAFRKLGRRVHPRHAEAIGLGDRPGVLELLFERATEAYLVLSDPHRRQEYDRLIAADAHGPRDPGERAEEAREVARDLHDRALALIEREEYHFAVELLKQAVRMDPGAAPFWALLGRAQRANPSWLHMAADSLRRALQLQPESIEHRLALAEVEAARGDAAQAQRYLRDVLDREPGHPTAVAALEALDAKKASSSAGDGRRGFLRGRS